MPRFRPRFTVRRLMVAVAIVALVLCGWETWRKRSSYLELADQQSALKDHCRLMLEHVEFLAERRFADKSEVALSRRRMDYHRDLAEKYERAARYPWLPVAPDPPEPE
jgi:FtsZ-interacting cell division protein ZipA